METNKAFVEKLKELNALFATVISKLNADIQFVENSINTTKLTLDELQQEKRVTYKTPVYISPELLNSWQPGLN